MYNGIDTNIIRTTKITNSNNFSNDDDECDSHGSSDTESFGFSEPPTPTIEQTLDQHFETHPTTITTLSTSQCHDLCRIILHAADISNTVRPWSISKQWSDLIVQEFFQQGDAEKQAGLDISPGMDRSQSNQATISLKFGDFVVKPYFEALAGVLPKSRVFLTTLAENRLEWMQMRDTPMMTLTPPPPPHERHFPSRLLPSDPVPNPSGRRVSVPAGLVVIPEHQYWQKQQRFINKRRPSHLRRHLMPHQHRISKLTLSPPQQHQPLRHRFAVRSASHPLVLPDLIFHHTEPTPVMAISQLSQLFQAHRKSTDNGSNNTMTATTSTTTTLGPETAPGTNLTASMERN
jgi:hypothetical protein